MGRSHKKQREKLDLKKFAAEPIKVKKQQDWTGDEIFKEIQRSKSWGKPR